MIQIAEAGWKVLFSLCGEKQGKVATGLERGERAQSQVVQEPPPLRKWYGCDAIGRVFSSQHGVVRRITEHEIAVGCLSGKSLANIMRLDFLPNRLDIVR
jgi:hypothetical protein